MRPLPPVTPLPLQPGPQFPRVRRDDPLTIHIRDKSDPHHVRDRLVDIGILRKNEDGSYSPGEAYGVMEVLVNGVSVVTGGTASIDLTGKVDKEQGKGLSSNDYTTEEKAKLTGIETGAQKNVGVEYTSTEKQKLTGIEAGAQKNVGVEYTAEEKQKLAGVESGAQVNAVTSVNTKTGAVSLSASDVGALSKAEAESGFTEWEAVSVTPGYAFVSCEWDGDNDPPGWAVTTEIPDGLSVQELVPGAIGDTSVGASFLTLSRAKLRPTKTSELENDSGFLTAHQSWADVLPSGGVPKSDLASDVQTSLNKADTALQTAPVTSVNGQTGAVALNGSQIPLYNLAEESVEDGVMMLNAAVPYALGTAITASARLADRTINRVAPLATNTENIVLTFPTESRVVYPLTATVARDFLALVTNTAGNAGSITFTPPTGATIYGDGFANAPASGETWLYSVTEVAVNTFWAKSVKMEVAQ